MMILLSFVIGTQGTLVQKYSFVVGIYLFNADVYHAQTVVVFSRYIALFSGWNIFQRLKYTKTIVVFR